MIPLVFALIIGKAAENRLQLITDLKADGLHDSVQCFLHRIAIGQLGGRFTVAVAAVVLARNDVSDDAVYTFVSTIFDNTDTITEQHAKGAELSLDFASYITDVPYHAGAARYFADKGIDVAK